MEKISIIVPVYNVEQYVRKCLDSIINQTYENLEILLINDGSTDNSGSICDEFSDKDARIKVFHKANGGVSSAKNVGLRHLTGKYVGFVDSDDWIEADMYEILYKSAESENVQISVTGYYRETMTSSTAMTNAALIPEGELTIRNMLLYPLKRDCYMGFCGYTWNKIIRTDILANKGLTFDENINYGEDVLFYFTVVLSDKCMGVYNKKPLYHYIQRSTAISKSCSISTKTDILSAYKQVEKLMNDNGYSDISYWARGFYCYHASVVAKLALMNCDTEAFNIMQVEIEKHLDDYIETNREFPGKVERMYKLLEDSIIEQDQSITDANIRDGRGQPICIKKLGSY